MSISVDNFELKIDGEERNEVLDSLHADGDDMSYLDILENGYCPRDENGSYISNEDIVKEVMKKHSESIIFFRVLTDYGESAWEGKNGKVRELTKKWV